MLRFIRNLSILLRSDTWAVILCGIGAVLVCMCLCVCANVVGVIGDTIGR